MTELKLTHVNFKLPTDLMSKVDNIASKKLSNRSQVLREATLKGLELL